MKASLFISSRDVICKDFCLGITNRTPDMPTQSEALEPSPAPIGSFVWISKE